LNRNLFTHLRVFCVRTLRRCSGPSARSCRDLLNAPLLTCNTCFPRKQRTSSSMHPRGARVTCTLSALVAAETGPTVPFVIFPVEKLIFLTCRVPLVVMVRLMCSSWEAGKKHPSMRRRSLSVPLQVMQHRCIPLVNDRTSSLASREIFELTPAHRCPPKRSKPSVWSSVQHTRALR